MPPQLAIFDGDDTLWSIEQLYDDALDRMQRLVEGEGLEGDRWRELQRELDLANVITMGVSPDRFPLSSLQALERVSAEGGCPPGTVDRIAAPLDGIARSVFEAKAPLVPGAREVVESLREVMTVVLLTKGAPHVQQRRVHDSGLADVLDEVFIVDEKRPSTFVDVCGSMGASPSRSWSIGNSIPSDINPAVAAGLRAIWIDAHVWDHERREVYAPDPRVIPLASLKLVPDELLALVD